MFIEEVAVFRDEPPNERDEAGPVYEAKEEEEDNRQSSLVACWHSSSGRKTRSVST